MSIYKKLPLDLNKRHFVFGDIHGNFMPMAKLLNTIDYDPTTDCIYSVGDMIDRGPDSVEVVKFIMQENNHAALGNHEQMVVNPKEWATTWMYPPNGGPATLQSLKDHKLDIKWLRKFCKTLPVCLDVGEDDDPNAFRMIHAELPPNGVRSFSRKP